MGCSELNYAGDDRIQKILEGDLVAQGIHIALLSPDLVIF
jgi:hypothetical protein